MSWIKIDDQIPKIGERVIASDGNIRAIVHFFEEPKKDLSNLEGCYLVHTYLESGRWGTLVIWQSTPAI